MPTYEKRGKRTRVQLMVNGQRLSSTFGSKGEAVAWAAQQQVEGGKRTASKTLDAGLKRYAEEVSPGKRGGDWEIKRIAAFRRWPQGRRKMADLTSDDFAGLRDERLKACKPGTVLREFNLWSSIYETARREWKWVNHNPIKDVRKPPQPKSRTRVISNEERDAIVLALGYEDGKPENKSQEVAIAFLLALETAMRAGEITGLRKRHLHLEERYLHLPETKNGEPRDVPLSEEAVELLKLAPGEDRLWTFDDATRDVLFRKARARAGLSGFTFHDARRTATTALARKLTNPLDLARVTGHKNINQLIRTYYSPKASDLAKQL